MQTIGNKLEEARNKLGMSIVEAAEATKIRGEFLRNFEADNFDFDLPEIYKHGFLRTYARLLKLDPEKINTDYQAYRLGKSTPSWEVPDAKATYGSKNFGGQEAESFSGGSTVVADSLGEEVEERPESTTQFKIDNMLYVRIGVIALAFILSIVLLVFLFSIIFGDSGSREADSNLELREDPVLEASGTLLDKSILTFEALGDVRFRVTDLDSKELLFNGNLKAGESTTIREVESTTRIQIVATQRQNLVATFRGERYSFDQIGPGTLNLVE